MVLTRNFIILCYACKRYTLEHINKRSGASRKMKDKTRIMRKLLASILLVLSFGPFQAASAQSVIQSMIVSDFDGLDHGNFYELQNGQIWKQTEYWIWAWVWVNPKVLIYMDGGLIKMKVENIDHAVTVERIR